MPNLKHPKGTIYYEVKGEGPPLVALRGLGRTIRHWLGFDDQLSEHFQVITFDFRGVGRTTASWGVGDSIFDSADDLFMILDELNIEAAHILGVSLGGMVALAAGISRPQRCLSVTVINTSIAGNRRPRLTLKALNAIGRGLQNRDNMHMGLVDVLVGSDFPQEMRPQIAQKFAEIEKREGLFGKTVMKQIGSAARFHIKRKLRHFKPPLLIVFGTDDQFVPNIHSKKLFVQVPHARLHPIVGAGHELAIDHGDELIRVLKEFTAQSCT